MRRLLVTLTSVVLLVAGVAIAVVALAPTPGHTALHLGCTHHNHGPVRTAGEVKRLIDARSLSRQGRDADE